MRKGLKKKDFVFGRSDVNFIFEKCFSLFHWFYSAKNHCYGCCCSACYEEGDDYSYDIGIIKQMVVGVEKNLKKLGILVKSEDKKEFLLGMRRLTVIKYIYDDQTIDVDKSTPLILSRKLSLWPHETFENYVLSLSFIEFVDDEERRDNLGYFDGVLKKNTVKLLLLLESLG